jgi:hypothetical protein
MHYAPVTKKSLFSAAVCALLAAALAKATIYDEAVSGDLSNNQAAPTALTLTPGSNSVIGTVAFGDGDPQDWVSITIPTGFVMTSYVNSKYVSTDDQGFTGFQFGSSFSGHPFVAGSYAGYAHFGFAANNPDGNPVAASTVGVDLLPLMANPNFAPGATGFTPPLAAGTYTFLIQQFGFATTGYQFDMTVTPAVTSRLGNISTRGLVQTGDQVLIAGFILTGTDPKQVIVRGLGPTLGQPPFNVPNALQNPVLELHLPTSVITNDDWQSAANANQIPTSPVDYRPPNSLESAILITLQPGAYTAIMSGKNSTTGNGLVEVYDLATSTFSQLTNVSTRGFVGTGDNRMIGGFITSGGNGSTQVVVRGLGPTLGQPPFNVPGVLADPFLTLVEPNGMMVQNNNWKDTQQAAIQAASCSGSTCAPPNDLEAAILITVPPGNYTAILEGNGGGTGIGLVEVYKLP